MSSRPAAFLLLLALLSAPTLSAAEPAAGVRRIPPPGIAIPDAEREELSAGAAELATEIERLREELKEKPELLALLPDVQIFYKAVDWALRYDEFFDVKQVATARAHLASGMQRAQQLRAEMPAWNSATGLVVRGYISKIDGSVQPYGLVVPEDWTADDRKPRRLDFWLHGRDEKLTELKFIDDRQNKPGEFAPPGVFVLHPYGRFCNANKFAGEVDLFEALEDAKKHYPIDEQRLVMRGFSMGGAGAWQFATHYPGMWAAAAPGAGFAETAEFTNALAPGKTPPPPWEQLLWRWYDATLYAANLANVPTIAYSGEIDKQKQAADIMLLHIEKEGLSIPHIIGPQTAHKYHPDSKVQIEEFVTKAASKGRDIFPRNVRLTTYSLIYWKAAWLWLQGMERQWERADLIGDISDGGEMQIKTRNVASFHIVVPDGATPRIRRVIVDGALVAESDDCTFVSLKKDAGKWTRLSDIPTESQPQRRKQPLLCGPIDHAFMDSFVMVRPTGKPLHDSVGSWVKNELNRSASFWRQVFRGDAPLIDDVAVGEEVVANSHLILWGDPSSNAVIAKILPKLPIKWTADQIECAGRTYDAAHHAPVFIFPNPLNPDRYVVINSGPTFREAALLNNAQQTPKLPDWAVIDLRTPPDAHWPGRVVDAGMFDEQWKIGSATPP